VSFLSFPAAVKTFLKMQIATTLCKLCQCPVGARFSFGFRGIKKDSYILP